MNAKTKNDASDLMLLATAENRHVFASTGREWVVGENVVDAALKLHERAVRLGTLEAGGPGTFYEVPHPISTKYEIRDHAPVGVGAVCLGLASLMFEAAY